MKTMIVVLTVTALALVPVTLYAAFRSAPALERVVYVPLGGACVDVPLGEVPSSYRSLAI